jgi:hypothetical protein
VAFLRREGEFTASVPLDTEVLEVCPDEPSLLLLDDTLDELADELDSASVGFLYIEG